MAPREPGAFNRRDRPVALPREQRSCTLSRKGKKRPFANPPNGGQPGEHLGARVVPLPRPPGPELRQSNCHPERLLVCEHQAGCLITAGTWLGVGKIPGGAFCPATTNRIRRNELRTRRPRTGAPLPPYAYSRLRSIATSAALRRRAPWRLAGSSHLGSVNNRAGCASLWCRANCFNNPRARWFRPCVRHSP